jgi:hypothetical protein
MGRVQDQFNPPFQDQLKGKRLLRVPRSRRHLQGPLTSRPSEPTRFVSRTSDRASLPAVEGGVTEGQGIEGRQPKDGMKPLARVTTSRVPSPNC